MRFRRRTLALALIFAGLLALSGCVTTWTTETGPQKSSRLGLSVDLPAGWARFNPDRDIVLTRDGFLLQTIYVTRARYGSTIEHTERTLSAGIEEQEAAQILIDSLSADQQRQQLSVVENRPDTIAGQPGFRFEVKFRTEEKLSMREAYCVALSTDSYVLARLTAPERHYFDEARPVFDAVVASLQLIGPPPPLEKKKR